MSTRTDAPGDEDFADEVSELRSAEDFLDYFGVAYDPDVVRVKRLHILQRFHDYLGKVAGEPGRADYQRGLEQAYADFVVSDAQTEKVFRVFHMHEPKTVFVPVSSITRR
ncbi:nitrogenase-stabilizing/protective protein NifW [Rhodocyclus tenuis]|uniref:nitrogenase-stabilizing/protective protein NifW n=1 Tax=Rhodocyclus tenuis TaxID=1066 RepID=UPI001905881F|nr:nitrogenase-stabilizing/protective protein NifW [Rhodocyclus tenuis]MBK1679470.1 nitrogen fixation protein NifW [Rhodocyclus tenuis]